jgi:acyl-CoA synthetase (AMP-forming)/AMP-acid ligase II
MGSRVNLYPVDTIHGAFVAAANAHPDRIAVLGNDDDGTPNLSFRQLVNLCRSFAQHLTRTSSSTHARCGPAIFRTGDPSPGIAVGASVAVSLDSSIELIVAYFAVLMAGKAFAPLETTLPPAALTGVLSALHEHANLTHHIVSARTGETRENRTIPSDRAHARWPFVYRKRNLIREMPMPTTRNPGWRCTKAAFRSP